MTLTDAIRSRILQLCEENKLSIHSLAIKAAVPPSSIKNILYGDSLNPRVVLIKMICDALNMTLAEFFNTDEFNSLDSEVK
jgi:transcriptional regulator with XRE-family HTH domain